MQEVLRRFCLINKEYQRLICIREGCRFAIDLCQIKDYLINIHNISKFIVRQVVRSVSLLTLGSCREGILLDGLEV